VTVLSAIALGVSVVAILVSLWSAWSSRRSATAATRANANSLGSAVTVSVSDSLRERWNFRPGGLPDTHVGYPPGVCPVDRTFAHPRDDDTWILVGAHLTVRNEGQRSTTVSIEAFRVDRCDDVGEIPGVVVPPPESPSPAVTDGRIVLAPHESAGVIVRQGQTVGDWFAVGGRKHEVAITAEVSEDGSKQHWKLKLDAELLQSEYGNAAGCRAVPHRPPTVKLTELRRSYPEEPRCRIRFIRR
jgi:hypothetical protein